MEISINSIATLADDTNACPRNPHKRCMMPGPINGECCCITPAGPIGFTVSRRNDHHWDILTKFGRAFRVRGEPGNVILHDERQMDSLSPFPRDPLKFHSIGAAMLWVTETMLSE